MEPIELFKNEYKREPSKAFFKIQLENAVKEINNKLLLKPILIFPLKELQIDIEKRKYPVAYQFNFNYDITYQYELPKDYKIEFLPDNSKIETDYAIFDIQYAQQNNFILVFQKITTKKLQLEKVDFDKWNTFLKTLNKQYNQSIILIK